MKRLFFYKAFCLILGIVISLVVQAHEGQSNLANIQFIPNQGQWQHPFLYKGISANADIYLEKEGLKILVGSPNNNKIFSDYKDGKTTDAPTLNYHAYAIKWVGANSNPQTLGSHPESHYNNYYLGNNAANWKSKVPIFREVTYKDVYKGIDFYYYTEKGNLKYDIILKANADASLVKLRYEGLDGIKIKKGFLVLTTSVGEIVEQKPYAFQEIDGKKVKIECDYELTNNDLSFVFPNGYNKNYPLIIDPQMVFATLTGSVADNWGFTATYDAAGNFYAGGIAKGAGYPTSTGAIQSTYGGGSTNLSFGTDCDIAIMKFNPSGSQMLYSTYLGGSSNEMPHSLVVDVDGNLILSGKSASSNYPTSSNGYDVSIGGGFDIVITKLNSTGTALVGSTYIGGTNDDGVNVSGSYGVQSGLKHNYGDDARSEVLVDNSGNIYLASCTQSTGFPVTANAFKSTLGGTQDGVFLKMNPTLATMIYGTLIGGGQMDGAYSLAFDSSQSYVYVTGGTNSSDFHTASTTGAYQSTNLGNIDGFVMRIQNSGNYPLIRTTFIGTSAYDQIYGVQVDKNNKVYVMGQTLGAFPVFPTGVYQNAGSRQFVTKLDNTLATAIYSTVFGSGATASVNISPVAFLVDTCENVYISGWGGLSGSSTSVSGMPITPTSALQATTDGSDFYFIVLKKDALNILYGSYFGSGIVQEHVDGGTSRFDPNGVIYQAICASCGPPNSFPSTPGVYSSNDNSTNCNLGAVKIAFNLGAVSTDAEALPNDTGCAPFTVNFLDNSTNATNWSWNFGDGNTSIQQQPTHTYNTPGVYQVRLIGSNPDACRTLDTSYVTIVVTDNSINSDFNYTIIDSCFNLSLVLNNTSTGVSGSTAGATFTWDFGNGNTFTGANPPMQTYPAAGTYTIKLKMTQPGACNSPDSVMKTVTFNPINITASPLSPISVCSGASVNFNSTVINGDQYSWNFGDGNTSSAANASNTYSQPGTYTVTLIVNNDATCNKSDTVTTTVTVNPIPDAMFSVSPTIGELNKPFTFTNQSTGASSYLWEFGDGTTSTDENPEHSYNSTGAYQVCLTAKNQYGCTDKHCITVDALVQPLADVPSGFTPNGDGNNDVFRVRGYGIQNMSLKVFNRWGEQIFETTNQEIGWDGTYKGKPQEMESYAYLLVVDFIDGTHTQKQGNVTLIR